MSNTSQIECIIEETEKYIDELEYQLCDYEDVINQRDYLKSELKKGQENLNLIKIEKTNILNELIRETKELSDKCNIKEEHLIDIQKKNDSLNCENEQILNKLEDLEIEVEKLNNISLTLLEDKKILEQKLSEAIEITCKLQNRHQLAQTEVQDLEHNIICIQKALAEQITQITEVQKNINIEQDRYECLQSSICELKMKSENISKTLQANMTEIRNKYNEKSSELCMLKLKLKDKEAELLEQKNRAQQLKEEINLYQEKHIKEKCKIDKKIEELRDEHKSIASNLKCINSKLCDARMESTNLKCQIQDENEAIKQLEPMKEILQQELNKIKEATESTTEMITAQLKKYDNDKQIFEKKLESKHQELCELKKLSKHQIEQLTKLKKNMLDVNCNLAEKCVPNCTISS